MIFWLVACVLVLGALGVALLVPVSLSANLQGRAEPSGSWALAFGIGVGPLALSAVAASQTTAFMSCHLFGRQLLRLSLSRWLSHRSAGEDGQNPAQARRPLSFSRFERWLGRAFRFFDPLDTVLTWWEKERVFEVSSLELDVQYSFRDVALTGQILAALYVLSGVLPERYLIHQTPAWDCEDRAALVADARFRIWPGRLFVDVLRFVLKQRARARRRAMPANQ